MQEKLEKIMKMEEKLEIFYKNGGKLEKIGGN